MRRADSSPTGPSSEEPDHAADDADQAYIAAHDRLVSRVLGDQLDVAVAALEALDGGVPIDHRDHDRAVGRLLLRPHEDQIAVVDANVDHALAAHTEQEEAVLCEVFGEQHMVFDVLLGEDGRPGGDVAHDGYGAGIAPLVVEFCVLYELDAPRLAGIPADQAAPLDLIHASVDRRARAH